jgi:hypothetical protein
MVALQSSGVSGRRVAGRFRCLFVAAVALLWGALAGVSTQANTISIERGDGGVIGTVTTTGSILGYVAGGCSTDSPTSAPVHCSPATDSPFSTSATLTTFFRELINATALPTITGGGASNEANEAATLNVLTGTTSFTTGTKVEEPENTFSILAGYFSLKIDSGWTFFKVVSGGSLELTYTPSSDPPEQQGTGLSHYTTYGVAVPGPIVGAGLPGLIAACGGLLLLARRRRLSALAA